MVRQKPKGYSRRQQDKHIERLKNKITKDKRKTSMIIVRLDDRQVEEIAADFSQLLIEKKKLHESLKLQEKINHSLAKDNQLLLNKIKVMERVALTLSIILVGSLWLLLN